MNGTGNKSPELDSLVWLAIIAAVGLAAWIVIPNFVRARSTSVSNACVNNLRQIAGAKQEWALENGKTNGTVCTINDIKPYIRLDANGNLPKCPQGGVYTIGKVGEPPTCSLGKTMPGHRLP